MGDPSPVGIGGTDEDELHPDTLQAKSPPSVKVKGTTSASASVSTRATRWRRVKGT